jgi:mono/diheme cytochrome c family protein
MRSSCPPARSIAWLALRAGIPMAVLAANPGVGASPDPPDALPILLRHCAACHGATRPEAGLDLRTRASILKGGKSGPALVPGKPDESLILQKIRAGEMPPRPLLVEACVKPVEPAEAEALALWIRAGAPGATAEPDVAGAAPDPLVTDEDRRFWSFRPPVPRVPPKVQGAALVRNAIDAFLLEKLEARGLTLSPDAERLDLIRRATFDLTGLPPEPDEAKAFAADEDPLAYEKLIDRLLASPRYGERWGRIWLDLAGYADSEGKREQDLFRPHAYRYRDYVIRSFNADKPYDRFLLEQIAGDELADHETATDITPEIYDNLVATGFLRMAPDGTWANITGFIQDRLEVIADEMDVLGSSVMGLTIKCARCHDHKIDPVPARDYYRLLDVFKGAFDEHDWLKPEIKPGIGPVSADRRGPRLLPQVTSAERREWESRDAAIRKEIAALGAEPKSPDVDRRIGELEARRTPEPRIHALWDRGEPSPTYIYERGDPLRLGRRVGPGVPSVLTDGRTPFVVSPPWPGARKTGRRLAFARWLVRPDHPLTARVIANRIWKHHFGTGIVATLDDFGKAGAAPTHPELLDWLALELVRGGWRLKALHRLMMTSTAYRQSSRVTPERERLDPDGALLSRMHLRRMDAEELHDSLILAAGCLDESRYGPADPVEKRADGLATPAGTGKGWRRAVYARLERKVQPTILEDFDLPAMNPSCGARRSSTTATQALHLLNNPWVAKLAERLSSRVAREVEPGAPLRARVESVSWIALSRPPTKEEEEAALEGISRMAGAWTAEGAFTAYCHALINSAAFIYID